VGWVIVIGCIKKKIQIANLLRAIPNQFCFKIKTLQIVMFLNVFMNFKISKEKTKSACLLESLCLFKKKFEALCLSNFIHIISYKCKYVLFHLNMLRLFQEINMFSFFEIKVVSNKKFSLKYLIQGFNPHLLS
jgi:hypothetical protein